MKIVLTGGGSGGHIFPLQAVARKIKEKHPSAKLYYVGPFSELIKEVARDENIETYYISSGKVRRYFSWQNFLDPFRFLWGIVESQVILLKIMPEAIFSKGGYGAVPVVLVGWLYRIPILSHESDAVPGMSNRILGKFSRYIAVAYPSAKKYFLEKKTLLTGNPVRQEILKGDKEQARKYFEFNNTEPVILILGGSQGAQILNRAILKILPQLSEHYQIIHQTGSKNFEEVKREASQQGIKIGHDKQYWVKGFLNSQEMAMALALADLVISRAGANAIAEIAALSKVSILVPLSSAANDHQRMNAYALAKIGGALVLDENNLGEHILMEKIDKLLVDIDLRNKMKANIKNFYNPEAADKIVEGIEEIIKG